ncbi:MAG TPA: HlyD family efflux transporter periplasmic adaptor subunit [Burkholderiaceae bacterium]|jgi:membrane fusion protein, adhesin transport system|nr:HlyD family efflux transporter periplasmic adaptor subunit [Burkholderiaceae bacterium]
MSQAARLTRHEQPYLAFLSIALMAALVAFFIAWASTAELEEVTRGQGRVIPSSKEQVIQSLDAGVLTELLVRENDRVEKDQLLLRIDDTRALAMYRELQAKAAALSATAARLRAEAYGGAPQFPAEVRALPHLLKRESDAFTTRRRALDESTAGLKRGIELLDREIQITDPLVARGLVSEVELLRLKRQRNDLALQMSDRLNKFQADAASELIKVESELAQTRETVLARQDVYRRTEIRAPMKGTVKSIRVSTIGGVVQPGQEIMQIVPAEDTLVVEAFVKPSDVAFLHPGQPVVVKISAYDYAIYGGLDGVVEFISPDTLRDERRDKIPGADPNEAYYRVLVRTATNELTAPGGQPLPIIPGMTANVEMLSGKKTVLQYLLKPVNRAREGLRER